MIQSNYNNMMENFPKEDVIYLVGNWKSNKNEKEVASYFDRLNNLFSSGDTKDLSSVCPVLCPSFVHLSMCRYFIQKYNLPLYLGAQDISPFDPGSYTGEVNRSQLKDYVSFCIIGHSERRKFLGEDTDLLKKKTDQAAGMGIKVIYCVADDKTEIPGISDIIAYEPVFAIGTGKPDTPENAGRVIANIKMKNTKFKTLYGGSVNPSNIKSFIDQKSIDGVLPGKSSLDPDQYYQMLVNAAS